MKYFYRVYETYHESSESGTREYGFYTDLAQAKERALSAWKARGYPDPPEVSTPLGSLSYQGAWDVCEIRIGKYPLDCDMDENCNGYT